MSETRPWRRVLLSSALLAVACTAPDPAPEVEPAAGGRASEELAAGDPAEVPPDVVLAARPGPFQLSVDEVPAGVGDDARIEVVDDAGGVIGSGTFAEPGTALLRDLEPGSYQVRVVDGSAVLDAGAVTVPGEEPVAPAPPGGGATLEPGYNYLPTRDGTTLSTYVTLPGPLEDGPYPTLVEYSGYSPSNPAAQADQGRVLIPALGYALVQVNVRGTGCSGGSFDAFERIQALDGYDVIEAVAAQPWSDGVGMYGISYPGIMQLHVASTRPPSLDAIAPLSVIDRVDSVLYPGGIYNDGFGEQWSREVSERATAGGQQWDADRIAQGDEVCEANQRFRAHNPDLVATVRDQPVAGTRAEARSPETWAGDIDVPVFLAGAWQDEQTGGRFPALLDDLASAPALRAVLYNGLHVDAASPELLVRLSAFYDLYVADRPAGIAPGLRALAGLLLTAVFGGPLEVPESPYAGLDPAEGRAAFEADPPVVVLFEQGATAPNLPVPSFEARFETWPPRRLVPTTLFVAGSGDDLRLQDDAPAAPAAASFDSDPAEGGVTTVDDLGTIWTDEPAWAWPAPPPERAVVATTGALAEDRVLVGEVLADLWLSVEGGSDADLEVTVSEVAPDGAETYVQTGWLRLSRRAVVGGTAGPQASVDDGGTAPLVDGGEPVLARVEVQPFAHVFRAGSRLRITLDTPGASRPRWRFDVVDDPVRVTLHSEPERPSTVILPVVPGVKVPTERPACGTLRGQPCRPG